MFCVFVFHQPEDTQNHQLIPIKKLRTQQPTRALPLPVSNDHPATNQQLDESAANNNNDKASPSAKSGSQKDVPSPKKNKALNKKQKEKSNKQQKSAKSTSKKKKDGKKSSSDTKDAPEIPEKEAENTTTPLENPTDERPLPLALSVRKRSADDGTYDILPLIRIDEYDEDMHLAQMDLIHIRHSSEPPPRTDSHESHHLLRSATGFGRSADSIPFIDDSPRKLPNNAVNYHEERFITIQPQNVGTAALTKSLPTFKPAVPPPLPSRQTASLPAPEIVVHGGDDDDAMDGSEYDLHQQQPQLPQLGVADGAEVEHHFRTVPQQQVDAKLCQMCHEFMNADGGVVRCLTCGLVCHEVCATNKVSRFIVCSSIDFY